MMLLRRLFALVLSTILVSTTLHAAEPAPLSMLDTQDGEWRNADGKRIALKGVNLGNWLILDDGSAVRNHG